ncbi:uncharacterized protein ACRADG_002075 [Cochliomyia hominivorax]
MRLNYFWGLMLLTCFKCQAFEEEGKPNIVIIMADDMGFDDVSFRGSNEFLTPNIDALAYSGVILNNLYTSSMCTPSRSALLTGKYPINTGMQHYVIVNDQPWSLPLNETTMAEIFRQHGYYTSLIGKWHLGMSRKAYTPTLRGFDQHYGYLGSYVDYYDQTMEQFAQNYSRGHDFRDNLKPSYEGNGTYVTDLLTNAALKRIRDHNFQKKPLFMILSHMAPHSANDDIPLQAPAQEIEKFSYIENPERRIYAAMMSKLDESVGLVVKGLAKKGVLNNTILLFLSDNGGPSVGMHATTASNYPFRGQKNSPWEGGIRSSAAIWSTQLEKLGTIWNQPIYIADLLPTLTAAANIFLDLDSLKLDGLNLWSALKYGYESVEREILHNIDEIFQYEVYSKGKWKYINGTTQQGLYDNWLSQRPPTNSSQIDPRSPFYEDLVKRSPVWQELHKLTSSANHNITQMRDLALVKCLYENSTEGIACNPLESPCLFDLDSDPCEQQNLYEKYKNSKILTDMLERIEHFRENAHAINNKPTDYRCDPANFGGEWTWWEDILEGNAGERVTALGIVNALLMNSIVVVLGYLLIMHYLCRSHRCSCCWFYCVVYLWLIILNSPQSSSGDQQDDKKLQQSEKPHIIIILIDDMGFNDVSFHGSNQILTPNIDALAYNGIILNRNYVPNLCTPSRSTLLTGKYPIHTGMHHFVIVNDEPWGLPLRERLMPEIFRDAGYSTNLVGKWHLGFYRKEMTPVYRGFDHHLGYYSGYIGYYDHMLKMLDRNYTGLDMRRDLDMYPEASGIYATDLFTQEAVQIIKQHNVKKPLFLLMSHLAVHTGNENNPMEAPEEEIKKFGYIKDPKRRKYAAMLSRLDKSVGKTVQALSVRNMLNNSIILLYSDNGAPTLGIHANGGSNYPFRGQKESPWEGGIRSAGLIWSPFLKQKNYVSNQITHAIDWLPTLAHAAKVPLPENLKLDGINLWPALSEAQDPQPRRLLHAYDNIFGYSSYMNGNLKYVNGSTFEGKYDHWMGLLDPEEEDPFSENYEETIMNSEVFKILNNNVLNKPLIKDLRQQSTHKCPYNAEDYHQDIYKCEPLKAPCYFNIEKDPCERYNLANLYPLELQFLQQEVEEYEPGVTPSARIPYSDPLANPQRFDGNWQWWYGSPPNSKGVQNAKFSFKLMVFIILFLYILLGLCRAS